MFVDPGARRTPPETSASTRPLAASVQAPRRGFGEQEVRGHTWVKTRFRSREAHDLVAGCVLRDVTEIKRLGEGRLQPVDLGQARLGKPIAHVGIAVRIAPRTAVLPSARHRRARPDRLVRGRDLVPKRLQRGDVDLRERGERLNRVAEDIERDAGADRERRLLQPLARLGAERVGAGQPLAVAEERQEAVVIALRPRVGGGLGDL